MSLTNALYTGLTGMDASTKSLDVIGNNITNVNTVGFKSSTAVFQTQLANTISQGTAPTSMSGGTNAAQIGLGVQLAGVQKNFTAGAIQSTGIGTQLALESNGMFIINQNGQTYYTRDGSFALDSGQNLATASGAIVQGYGVDDNFNVVPVLKDINIPLGKLPIAEATRNATFSGNLNASGTIASQGTLITSQAFVDMGNGGANATATSNLTDLSADGTTPSFADGEVITLQAPTKGGKTLGTFKFQVGATNTTGSEANGTTVQDFMNFLRDTLGIDTTVDGAGVSMSGGQITIKGNYGSVNDLQLRTGDVVTNGSISQPFILTKAEAANGESVRTSFVVYDSLGTPINVDLTAVLSSRDANGTNWKLYASSPDDTRLGLALGNGTVSFDSFGQFAGVSNPYIAIQRTNTGAVDPLTITMNFDKQFTALTDTSSTLAAISQDGSPTGNLQSYSIGQDGMITGSFSNGLTRTLGQIALANFANPNGLLEAGPNIYKAGPNSGLPVVATPMTFGTSRIIAGALELSNVDLSQEFVRMISATTGFSSASKLITTADQMMQQLLNVTR